MLGGLSVVLKLIIVFIYFQENSSNQNLDINLSLLKMYSLYEEKCCNSSDITTLNEERHHHIKLKNQSIEAKGRGRIGANGSDSFYTSYSGYTFGFALTS